jgi:phospholipase C
MYRGGKSDGADLIPVVCGANMNGCPPPNAQFAYVNPDDVQPYFLLAEQYTFADRMFQTNQGPSFPAHQFIISGTSAPTATSPLFAAENPISGAPVVGCIGPSTETVAMIDPSGNESSTQYPCFEHPTLTDLLDAARVTWRYYANSSISVWTGPDAIQHICQPQISDGQRSCTGADWGKVVIPETQVLVDIANGQLPDVSWVTPNGSDSDHATANDGSGPSWVASVVNAIGNSQYWADTAVFIAWDDWGGWYDHVAPKIINSYEYGFRVPFIVVSPYARAGYISHVPHDFGSVLKFIENAYGLASLGYADVRADDLSDCFNFNQTPISFKAISAPLPADHFLYERGPSTDPDDD